MSFPLSVCTWSILTVSNVHRILSGICLTVVRWTSILPALLETHEPKLLASVGSLCIVDGEAVESDCEAIERNLK